MPDPGKLILTNQYGEETDNVVGGNAVPLPGGNGKVVAFAGATAPVDGTTGKDFADKGSLYVAQDTGILYQNDGTLSSPAWEMVGGGAGGGVSAVTGTAPIASSGGSTPAISIPIASDTQDGALSKEDFAVFDAKQAPLTPGAITSTTSGLHVTGGAASTVGPAVALSADIASDSQPGFLSAADHAAFVAKQPAGSYITAISGDATAAGPGSAALTLKTVNASPGATGDASHTSAVTTNAKGLVTANTATPIQIAESQVTNLVSDLAGKQPVGNYITSLTGDVTASGPGASAATIAGNAVTNAKAAQMAAHTLKGNSTGIGANAQDLSVAAVNTLLASITNRASYVYQPGNPSPTMNIYSDWNLLYADLIQSRGQRSVLISDSLMSPAVIPAGTYNMAGVNLTGATTRLSVAVELADGCVMTNLTRVTGGLNITSVSNSPIITYAPMSSLVFTIDALASIQSLNAPFFHLDETEMVLLLQSGGSFDNGGGAGVVFELVNSSFLIAYGEEAGIIDINIMTDDGTGVYSGIIAANSSNLEASQVGFIGAISISSICNSLLDNFTSSTGLTSTDVQSAIDEVNAKITGFSGTVALAKITPVSGANGSLTVVNGLITAYVAPT